MTGSILLTGGTGFIGSHVAVSLLEAGQDVIIFDNLSNSDRSVVERVATIAGRAPIFVEGDLRDKSALTSVFENHQTSAVMHFAGLKSVSKSQSQSADYWDVNVGGSVNLVQATKNAGVRRFVFSSSATVYAASDIALKENAPLGPVNVYGRTKLAVETLLSDVAGSDPSWRIAVLRYFNPAGGHASGLLREAPSGVPENLVPMIAQLAAGERSVLSVFGTDYPTEDGTALRDYIHVSDLADGHIAALHALDERQGVLTLNLGTGTATSVRQLVRAFETELGRKLPVTNAPRRDGDAPISFADTEKARRELSWQPKRGIKDICRDALLGRLD